MTTTLTSTDNEFLLSGSVEIIYEGKFSPVGPAEIVPSGKYIVASIGDWILKIDKNECTIKNIVE